MNRKLFLALLLVLVPKSHCENVLGLFLHPGYSHFHSFYPIMSGLADRGHNVKIVTFFPIQNHSSNYVEILLTGAYSMNNISVNDIQPSRTILKLIHEYYILEKEGKDACKIFYESGAVKSILDAHATKPFDLTILEVFNTDCALGVIELIKTPIIGLSSCAIMPWHYDRVGLPDFPSYIPSEFVGASFEMNFIERLTNFFIVRLTKLLYRYSQIVDNRIIHKYLGLEVDVGEIMKNTSLILVNQHYSISGSRPLNAKVIEIGGVHIPVIAKTLPQDLMKFVEESKDGIILISWGSMVNFSSIPAKTIKDMKSALSKFDESIVWKFEGDLTATSPKKFYFSKWIPQYDLLCHPKVKLFWSHGGLLGTSESVHCAVPMVITPMYGDQFLNAKAIQMRKLGEVLMYHEISEETVYDILSKVLHPDYASQARYVSNVFRNRLIHPLETAIWWIEHVMHTKGNNLTYSPSVEMNWFTYYSLDSFLALSFVALLVLMLLMLCLKKILDLSRKQFKWFQTINENTNQKTKVL